MPLISVAPADNRKNKHPLLEPVAVQGQFWVCVVFLCALCLSVSVQAREPFQEGHFRFKTLANPQIDLLGGQWATVQDEQGFIWFGGAGGVGRYDGYELKLYRHAPEDPNSLSNNYVTDLLVDGRGRLWVSTLWGLNLFDAKRGRFIRFEHNPNDPKSLSHNWVWQIAPSGDGSFWLATDGGGLELFNPATKTFEHYRHNPQSPESLASDALQSVYKDSKGIVWVGTKDRGLDRFDPTTKTFQHFRHQPGDSSSLSHNKVNVIYEDSHGRLWVGTDVGVNLFNRDGQNFERFVFDPKDPRSINHNYVRSIAEDAHGNVWFACDGGGLNIYREHWNGFERYSKVPGDSSGLVNNKVRSIFKDNNGGMWFGHYPAGVTMLDLYASAFDNYQHSPFTDNSLSNSDVISVAEDSRQNLWVGTEKGLNYLNRKTAKITRYHHDPKDPSSLPEDPVSALAIDRKGQLWAGTWGGGLGRFLPESQSFVRYLPGDQPGDLKDLVVRVLLVDSQGTLWLGSGFGLSRYVPETDSFIHFENNPLDPGSIMRLGVNALFEDSKGNFWVGGDLGLHLMDRKKGTFKRFEHNAEDPDSLSAGYISSIGEDKKGNLWVATGANGVNRLNWESKTFEHFTVRNGLADDRVGGIIRDAAGDLWFGTGRGLSRFDGSSFQNYTREHGLPGNIYKRPTTINTKAGELVFGSTKGLTIFKPDDIETNTVIPPVVITDFHLFNKPVSIDDKKSPIKNTIAFTESITLDYWQSVFSFEFVSLNYIMPERNEYAYQLEGFDKDWVYAGDRRATTYTNLDAGDYVFRVKASNNEGVWNNEGTEIYIKILPPPWRTWWAYTIYVLSVMAALTLFVRSQQQKVREAEEKMEMERKVVQRLEHLDKLKDDFLANTSHELRTPLNGIIGLCESLIDGAAGPLNEMLENNLNMISISGRRLAHLVNDILDFSKLKNRNISLKTKAIDLHLVAEVVLTICRPSARAENLKLINNIGTDLPAVLADDDRLQQILYNLVGNAIKFTEEGSIEVSAEVDGDKVWVHVRDTGIGIPDDMIDKIFVSFEQVEHHESRKQGGTGLGLTVTRQMVELHKGEIKVESKVNEGSTFSFSLPITDQQPVNQLAGAGNSLGDISKCLAFEGDNKVGESHPEKARQKTAEQEHKELEVAKAVQQGSSKDNARFKIMVVDDDSINRQVLLNQLKMKNYTIETAASGKEALEYLETRGPFDLILLDIMMPEMSGYEVCARIRVNYSIQELPIIFLTAKNLIVDLADGFQLGANDFLTKPISVGELSSRVRTHLELLDINRNLETKVKQRTKEVTMANRELETLDTIVATIHQELRFDRLLQVILNEAMTLFPAADCAAYWKFEKDENVFKLLSAQNALAQPGEAKGMESLSVEQVLERYAKSDSKISEHIYLLNAEKIRSFDKPTADIQGAKSALAMSMILDGEVVGVLLLASKESEDTFISSQPSTLDRFRAHVISALSKSNLVDLLERNCNELENISVTDQLTGLRNRRYLYNHINSDISTLLNRHQKSLAAGDSQSDASRMDYIFFIMDVDHFKSINDNYGHVSGDKVLAGIGSIIKKVFRESDYCIRWGGEEFLVVARFSSRDSAPQMAEKLRSMVEEHVFVLGDDSEVNRTCSIGFAPFPFCLEKPDLFDWEQVLDVADACLYAAKKTQRNAWLGVYADEQGCNKELITKFLENPEECINSGALRVSTCIDKNEKIIWK